jgi:YebC/PmpR family DNA-binding regulatory protein
MGRAFEKRKHKMFARYDKMAKAFTRVGKDIAIAVKEGGINPDYNARLRAAIQNARGVNMPKDRIEAAIKRASSKDTKDFEEITYEGYAPHGVALIIETATDNPTRTVANVRMYFNKKNGSLATTGSVTFMFQRKGLFKLDAGKVNLDDIELDLIDAGALDIEQEDGQLWVYTDYNDFGTMQKFLEDKQIETVSNELCFIPLNNKELSEEQMDEVLDLIELIEADDDVQRVFHNLA